MSRLLPVLILLAGCGVDTGKKDAEAEPEGPLSVQTWDDVTNNGGIVEVVVDVDDDVAAFMVTGESEEYVSLERLLDPDGNVVLHWQDWWSTPQSLTNAFFGFDNATGFNWPIREEDGPLAKGEWTAELSTIDNFGNYAGKSDITVSLHTKRDEDLEAGTAHITIVWAEGIDDDPELVSAVEDSVERWREVWGAYGLSFEETYLDSDLDPTLGFTYSGTQKVESIAEDLEEGSLIVVIGEQIGNEYGTYGVAGGIPGTVAPSEMSYVVIAWLSHAGGNGKFDPDEIRLMGETMAHEVGHYVGLFHPVEWDYNFWDALTDTPECDTWQTCESAMADNLMFPYPICTFTSCDPQDQLSADQQAVAHRYTGLL